MSDNPWQDAVQVVQDIRWVCDQLDELADGDERISGPQTSALLDERDELFLDLRTHLNRAVEIGEL